jgi:hypothetical protein
MELPQKITYPLFGYPYDDMPCPLIAVRYDGDGAIYSAAADLFVYHARGGDAAIVVHGLDDPIGLALPVVETGIDLDDLRSGRVRDDQWDALWHALHDTWNGVTAMVAYLPADKPELWDRWWTGLMLRESDLDRLPPGHGVQQLIVVADASCELPPPTGPGTASDVLCLEPSYLHEDDVLALCIAEDAAIPDGAIRDWGDP